MYSTVTHTWNAVSGKCVHNCAYCYVKKLLEHQRSIHLLQEEFITDLGKNNTIFVALERICLLIMSALIG